MNIYVNARFLTQRITGVQRYALELSKRLKDSSLKVTFLSPKNVVHHDLAELLNVRKVGQLKGPLWEQLELPYFCKGSFLFNPCNIAPFFKHNQIVTIHDASVFAVPEAFSRYFRLFYTYALPQISRVSKHIITDSNFSREELIKYCQVDPKRISSIHLGIEHALQHSADPQVLAKHGLEGKPFVLSVSSLDPRKNFTALMKATALLDNSDFNVVIAGGTSPIFQSQTSLATNVRYVGYVSDEELRGLYENAAAYISTSLYEGFGFTPLEAMACGCPVVVSNAASLPEVCGDAALYCDPHDPKDIAEKIKQLVYNPSLQKRLREKGFEQAKRFTWHKCTEETIQVIHRVLQQFP